MECINEAIQWYQQKIGAYDKQLWETSVEQRVIQGIQNVPKKTARVKSELIDVDLVRGSTFSKAKPQHGWLAVTCGGVVRVILLPLYVRWWQQQTSGWFGAMLLLLYIMQVGTMIVYLTDDSVSDNGKETLSLAHLTMPVLLMMTLAVVHAHIVSSSIAHRRSEKKANRKQVENKVTKSCCHAGGASSTTSPATNLRHRFTVATSVGGQLVHADSDFDDMGGCWNGVTPQPPLPPVVTRSEPRPRASGRDRKRAARSLTRDFAHCNGARSADRSDDGDDVDVSHDPSDERDASDGDERRAARGKGQRRRRVAGGAQAAAPSLSLHLTVGTAGSRREGSTVSSGESDTPHRAPNSAGAPQSPTSEADWDDALHSEVTCSSDSTTSEDTDASDSSHRPASGDDQPANIQHVSSIMKNLASTSDKVSCMIWEKEDVKKVDLTVLELGWTIVQRVDSTPEVCDYLLVAVILAAAATLLPFAFRLHHARGQDAICQMLGNHWRETVVILNGVIQRTCFSLVFYFLLSVAERTFKQRLLYAKHFCYLTSCRRAKKYDMPHFRLNKVRNIKTWLSLRSFLKKRGPQRSVDTIVSFAFLLAVTLVSYMCVQLLQDSGAFFEHMSNWELMVWCLALGVYLLRFMTLGTKVNRKYRNFSVLITEQINLYLHMEKKPHKKEELTLANNVLKLAEALLKELESPFKISGLSANPFLYNVTKVVILSAFSAVLSELLGFKLKLYKIKLRT